jgi:hypothetical protein
VRPLLFACAVALAGALPAAAGAQGSLSKEGALFLLVPIGARSVGMGQAVVAAENGSEGLWWNPASLARIQRSEVSLSHSSSVVGTGDALSFVRPAGKAGVIALGAYLFTTGSQDATDFYGVVGTIYPRSVVLLASYAATFGARTSAGLSFKFLQDRLDCTCSIPTQSASTNALDAGVQFVADSARRLTLGVVLRNLGPRLQLRDSPQADPLPTRIRMGARYQVPGVAARVADGELQLSGELIATGALAAPAFASGAEFAFKRQFFLRAGYLTGSGDAAGASVGLGFQRGALAMDFSRSFGGFSADAGQPPTYLTLRFQF